MNSLAVPQRRWRGKVAITIAVLIAASIVCLAVGNIINHGFIILSPDRSGDELLFSLLIGVGFAVITVASLLWFRPKLRRRPIISVPILGVLALVTGFMLAIGPAMMFYNLYDFRKRPLIEAYGFWRISRFYQIYSRGSHYHLGLSDFSPTLDLYWDDYRWNAGDNQKLPVMGKCIRVHFERSGRALRFVQPEHVRAVPCPDRSRIIEAG